MNPFASGIANATIRIAGVWPLYGLTGQPSSVFTDAIEYEALPAEIADLIPDYDDTFDHADIDWDMVLDAALNKGLHDGVLLLAERPVYEPLDNATPGKPRACSYSWGFTAGRLFYGSSLNDALRQAINWGEAEWASACAPEDAAPAEQGEVA